MSEKIDLDPNLSGSCKKHIKDAPIQHATINHFRPNRSLIISTYEPYLWKYAQWAQFFADKDGNKSPRTRLQTLLIIREFLCWWKRSCQVTKSKGTYHQSKQTRGLDIVSSTFTIANQIKLCCNCFCCPFIYKCVTDIVTFSFIK